jgi:hypothetical protein
MILRWILKKCVVREGGGRNWLRIVSVAGCNISSYEPLGFAVTE